MTAYSNAVKAYFQSEIGLLEIVGSGPVVKSIKFVEPEARAIEAEQSPAPSVISDCLTQLDEYFRGLRKDFSLDLEPEGTDFQRAVWQRLTRIPYGQTASYLDIARAIGNKNAVRAVGAANGQNPISIVVPCHRVIGSDGKLTGYGGGLWRKEWLLKHEGVLKATQLTLI